MNRPIEKEVAIVQIEIGELKFGKFETSICDNRSSGTERSCNKVQILIQEGFMKQASFNIFG